MYADYCKFYGTCLISIGKKEQFVTNISQTQMSISS